MAPGTSERSLASSARWSGKLFSTTSAFARELRGGVVTGQDQKHSGGDDLVLVHVRGVHHHRDEVIEVVGSVALHLLGEITVGLLAGRVHLRRDLGILVAVGDVAGDDVGPSAEILVTVRSGTPIISATTTVGIRVKSETMSNRPFSIRGVMQSFDDVADTTLPRRHVLPSELRLQDAPQPVVGRAVDGDHVGGLEPRREFGGVHLLEPPIAAGQHLDAILVAGNHPTAQHVVPYDSAGRSDLLIDVERIGNDRRIEKIDVALCSAHIPYPSLTFVPCYAHPDP